MKAFYSILAVVGIVFTATVSVQATPITFGSPDEDLYYQNSGEYLGTFTGNDNSIFLLESALDSLDGDQFADLNLTFTTGTLSVYGWDTEQVPDVNDGSLVLIGSSNDGKVEDEDGSYLSGTWSLTPTTETLSFYSVKAGNQFALYYVNPADFEGSWSTSDLFVGQNNNNPEISHFSGIAGAPAPVPEPATMLLFGTGLAGLAGSRLRRKKK